MVRIIKGMILIKEQNQTPDEKFYRRKPDIQILHTFGCYGFVWVPKELRKKQDIQCCPGIYLGPGLPAQEHRLWDSLTKTVFQASTVLFDEIEFTHVP